MADPAELALREPRAAGLRGAGYRAGPAGGDHHRGQQPPEPGQRHRPGHRPGRAGRGRAGRGRLRLHPGRHPPARRPPAPALDRPAGRHPAAHRVRERPPGHHRRGGGAGSRPAHPRLPPVRERGAGRLRALPGRPPGPHRRPVGPVLGGGGGQSLRLAPPGPDRRGDHRGLRGEPDDRLPLYQAPHGQHAGGPRRGAHALLGGGRPGRRHRPGPLGLPPGRGGRRRPLVPLPPARLPLLAGHPAGRVGGPDPGRHRGRPARPRRPLLLLPVGGGDRRRRVGPAGGRSGPAPDRHRGHDLRRGPGQQLRHPRRGRHGGGPPVGSGSPGPGHRSGLVPDQAQRGRLRHGAADRAGVGRRPVRAPRRHRGRGGRGVRVGQSPGRGGLAPPVRPRRRRRRRGHGRDVLGGLRPYRVAANGAWWPAARPRAGGRGPTSPTPTSWPCWSPKRGAAGWASSGPAGWSTSPSGPGRHFRWARPRPPPEAAPANPGSGA